MISITRNLARQLHIVFRRALNVSTRSPCTPVTFLTGPDGLRVRVQTHDAAVEYYLPGSRDDGAIVAPFELLNECKGAKQDEVKLETTSDGQVIAGWNDGIPQVVQYDKQAQHDGAKFPGVPKQMAENAGSLLSALHDAMETADADAVRYSLNHIQLDGSQGRIVATDGRQVLVQGGCEFPWSDQLLVPRRTVFGCKELLRIEPVLIGKSKDWLTICVGPWTVHLRIETEGRFPAVDDHIQKPENAVAGFELGDGDAEFLVKAIKRLPSDDAYNLSITIDLNGAVAIRAKSENQPQPTEIQLSRSTCSGEPIRFNTNRKYLARACQLGFRQIHVFGNDVPVLCQDDTRQFVWALLTPEAAIKPSKDAIIIESEPHANGSPCTNPKTQRKHTPMAQTKTNENGRANASGNQTDESVGVDAVIEHAEALKTSLRESLTKNNELIASLKRHKRANKSVQTALASLRQLQSLKA
ncbi:MAG: hypothetical protein IH991_02255 [Planctomycetes bacterium]|nr:hypothetical protein [Planctomycetota bacterium]